MTALTRVLFPLPDTRRTPGSLLRWWESRRPIYNVFVGGAGLVTLGVMGIVKLLPAVAPPVGPPWPQLLAGVVVYGILANLCYSLGWGVEMGMRAVWGDDAPYAGPVLFRQGLSFAVGLTLLPIPLLCLNWAIRFLAHVL